MPETKNDLMEKIVSLCKRRGFVFPGSDIYGGLANSWDFGPYGSQMKKNIRDHWWKFFVESREDMVGLDAAIIMNPKVWEASGHIGNFSDPLVECKKCHSRFRSDHLILNKNDLKAVEKEMAIKVSDLISEFQNEKDAIRNLMNAGKILSKEKDEKSQEETLKIVISEIYKKIDERFKKIDDLDSLIRFTFEQLDISKRYLGLVFGKYLNTFVHCPSCNERSWGIPMEFNLMLKTFLGPAEESANIAYLRPETAQAMFVDFVQLQQTSRKKLPFGAAQIGKAFRNEITPGNFIFRTREFEQMEIEYFFDPKKSQWETLFDALKQNMEEWMKMVGIDPTKTHAVDIPDGERAHYSKRTIDFEFDYPFGQKELFGLAYRGDYDLSRHKEVSGKEVGYLDPDTNERLLPHVIEPSLGVERGMLAILLSAFEEQKLEGDDVRTVLHLKPVVAPVQVAVFPLMKNKPELVEKAREIFTTLKKDLRVEFDDNGNVGKRYRRQDEIGTPYCVTIDFDSLEDDAVTVRDRDTMVQERVKIEELENFFRKRFN